MTRTATETITIHLFSECCTRAGHVCHDPASAGGDVFEWGTGTEAELAAQAREWLQKPADPRNNSRFSYRCALNVLDYLGQDFPEYDHAARAYRFPVGDDTESEQGAALDRA